MARFAGLEVAFYLTVIYPQQVFAIPRDISEEEQQVAIQRARKRGEWQVADGPDHYVLEGVRE